jgi:putative redox protein
MLLGALGACTSMTMRMYAGRKGWALRSVEVTLERRKVEGEKGARDEVLRGIRMEGDLDAEQRRRLLEIADRCPVHRALSEGTRVVTEAR